MNIYKLTVSYKGTNYQGFQVQTNGRTIQGEINSALRIISKDENVKSIGSGRTDTGVHAFAQIVRVEIPVDVPPAGLVRGMNSHLPLDIRILNAEKCTSEFHPIFSARSKEYNYIFTTTEYISPMAADLVTDFSFDLDFDLMKKGCELFIGKHDFVNFQCTGTDVDSTVREILECELIHCRSTGHWANILPDYYVFRVVGTGFLKQMVRLMMGALWSLGRGKITLLDLENSLKIPRNDRLGATAPPQGLYLVEVHY